MKLPLWMMTHVFYRAELKTNSSESFTVNDNRQKCSPAVANLVSSLLYELNGKTYHRPLIDLDFNAALIPSSTEGRYHLYLDKVLDNDQYMRLLTTLRDLGIIGQGNVDQMTNHESTTLRLPHIKKGNKNDNSGFKGKGTSWEFGS